MNFYSWKPRRAEGAGRKGAADVIDLCTQSALPLLPPPLRLLLATWGYPPARARLTDLRRAAHQGDVSAQFTLGWMYEHGDDVPQDHREAATWYKRAADQDNAAALNVVGVLYAPAQYNLGRATYNGDGTPLDRELAATWCRRAADQGYANAQFTLGWMYDDGAGVPPDYREAVMWYTRAAGQGHAKAQFSLALMLDAGRGTSRSCSTPGAAPPGTAPPPITGIASPPRKATNRRKA